MRFSIRSKDKAAGVLSLAAAGILLAAFALMGIKQRWFAHDYRYKTLLESAAGLSPNMNVLYKGFTIGAVRSFFLRGDEVEVLFTIYDEYHYLAKTGSVVELQISPIGLGSQFLFYPGRGADVLEEGAFVPNILSKEAEGLAARGLVSAPRPSDSVSLLLNRVNSLLADVGHAVKGDETTTLGRSFLSVEKSLAELSATAVSINTLGGSLLNEDSAIYKNIEGSLSSIAGILLNVDKMSSYLPSDMPQVSATINELRKSLQAAEDVLVALSNNPLLKKGVPTHARADVDGANSRNVEF
jgi:phospholipid/cholesterol/gamma-HCH transport system substrate-binding protein